MATALLITFTAVSYETGHGVVVGVSSQTITFLDVPQAEKALKAIKEAHEHTGDLLIVGTILKDVII